MAPRLASAKAYARSAASSSAAAYARSVSLKSMDAAARPAAYCPPRSAPWVTCSRVALPLHALLTALRPLTSSAGAASTRNSGVGMQSPACGTPNPGLLRHLEWQPLVVTGLICIRLISLPRHAVQRHGVTWLARGAKAGRGRTLMAVRLVRVRMSTCSGAMSQNWWSLSASPTAATSEAGASAADASRKSAPHLHPPLLL